MMLPSTSGYSEVFVRLNAQFQASLAASSEETPDDRDLGIQSFLEAKMSEDVQRAEKLPDVHQLLISESGSTMHHNKLVRLRMMVQETLDPEVYVGALKPAHGAWVTSKYNDNLEYSVLGDVQEAYWKRQPVHVMPVAGRSEWCHSSDPNWPSDFSLTHASVHENGVGELAHDLSHQHLNPSSMMDSQVSKSSNAEVPSKEGLIVLLYDGYSSKVRIHDVIEVIGVLSPMLHEREAAEDEEFQDDSAALQDIPEEDDLMDEIREDEQHGQGFGTKSTASCRQPERRVHAMHVKVIKGAASSPYHGLLLKRTMTGAMLRTMRASAIQWLSLPFGGDLLAAELLLLQLLYRPAGTAEQQRTLGRMALNLYGLPQANHEEGTAATVGRPYGMPALILGKPCPHLAPGTSSSCAAAVAEACSAIYPNIHLLPLTPAVLGSERLFPFNIAATNRLQHGILQVPPHTATIFDETLTSSADMKKAAGLPNTHALRTFTETGAVTAHYQFHQVHLPSCSTMTILSTGPALLADSCYVCAPIKPVQAIATPAEVIEAAERSPLQGVRAYMASVWELRESQTYSASGEDGPDTAPEQTSAAPLWVKDLLVREAKTIVQSHQVSSAAITASASHSYNCVISQMRMLAASKGKRVVGTEEWDDMRLLNARIASRVKDEGPGEVSSGPVESFQDGPPVHVDTPAGTGGMQVNGSCSARSGPVSMGATDVDALLDAAAMTHVADSSLHVEDVGDDESECMSVDDDPMLVSRGAAMIELLRQQGNL